MTLTHRVDHEALLTIQKRAAIYARVSTDKQEEEGTSLESQVEAALRYCQDHDYAVSEQHIVEDVFTGTEYRTRPGILLLRAAARNREFDVLVVHAFDRLARKQVHQAVILDDLEHNLVTVESVTENFDDSALGQFMRSVYAFLSELEREKILERMERGKRTRVNEGHMLGQGKAAYGYRWKETVEETRTGKKRTAHYSYEIDPITGHIVRRIFLLAANGTTIRSIAMILTGEGVPSPGGKPYWHYSTIRAILTNEHYTGRATAYRYVRSGSKKTTATKRPLEEQIPLPEGTIPALVDADTFNKIQEQFRLNKERASRNNPNPQDSLLRAGIARCGICKRALAVQRNQKEKSTERRESMREEGNPGWQKHYHVDFYFCRHRSLMYEKHNVYASLKALDELVWDRVKKIIRDPQQIEGHLAAKRQKDPTQDDLAAIERNIATIDLEVGSLVEIGKGVREWNARASIVGEINNLGRRRTELEQMRSTLLMEQRAWEVEQERIAEFEQWCKHEADNLENATYERRRYACEFVGVRVYVYPAGHKPRHEIGYAPPSIVSGTSPCSRNTHRITSKAVSGVRK